MLEGKAKRERIVVMMMLEELNKYPINIQTIFPRKSYLNKASF